MNSLPSGRREWMRHWPPTRGSISQDRQTAPSGPIQSAQLCCSQASNRVSGEASKLRVRESRTGVSIIAVFMCQSPVCRLVSGRLTAAFGGLNAQALLALAGGGKGFQLGEAAGPAEIVVVAVDFRAEAFVAEMHFGLVADRAQHDRYQRGVLATVPFPGEGQARRLFQGLEL